MDWYVELSLKWVNLQIVLIALGILTIYETENNVIEFIFRLNDNFKSSILVANNLGRKMIESPSVYQKSLETQVNSLSTQTINILHKSLKVAFDMGENLFIYLIKILTGTIRCLLTLFLDVGYDLTTSVLAVIQSQINTIIAAIQKIVSDMESQVNDLVQHTNSDFQSIKDVIESVIGDIPFLSSFELLNDYKFPSIAQFLDSKQLTSTYTNEIIQPFLDSKPNISQYWDSTESQLKSVFESFTSNFSNIQLDIPVFKLSDTPERSWVDFNFNYTVNYDLQVYEIFHNLYYIAAFILFFAIILNITKAAYSLYCNEQRAKFLSSIIKKDSISILNTKIIKDNCTTPTSTTILQYTMNPLLFKISRQISPRHSTRAFNYLNTFTYTHVSLFCQSALILFLLYNTAFIAKGLLGLEPMIKQDFSAISNEAKHYVKEQIEDLLDESMYTFNSEFEVYLRAVETAVNAKVNVPINNFRYLIGNSTKAEVGKVYTAINNLADAINWPEFSTAIKGLLKCSLVDKIESVEKMLKQIADSLELKLEAPVLTWNKSFLDIPEWFEKKSKSFNCTIKCLGYKPVEGWDILTHKILANQHAALQFLSKSKLFCAPFDEFLANCTNSFASREISGFLNQVQKKVTFLHVVSLICSLPWVVLIFTITLKYVIIICILTLQLLLKCLKFLVSCAKDSTFLGYQLSIFAIRLRPFVTQFESTRFSKIMQWKSYKEKYLEWKIISWSYLDGLQIRVLTYFNKI
eukprot:NODE_115_length_19014_cov_0.489664.p1 type:complete len:748 gc:universal NODE_115_length_19014_cov_0.489664:4371-2128(-)